jgi:cellulose synthase/poly-beta-1,6-N-acetylglucosamine synthase-like glycosyltransferase
MAFEDSKGFGNIHPGEDPDLSIRLWKLGYKTKLISNAFVYHKRRIDWNKFYTQVNKFGLARPILNSWYPEYAKITFWFPTLFLIGFLFATLIAIFNFHYFLYVYGFYFLMLFITSLKQNKSIEIAFYSLVATIIQFYGYGKGFLLSFFKIHILKQKPEIAFPKLFFKR